jgi:ribosomal protein S18 acetylase RimI-like enzyme
MKVLPLVDRDRPWVEALMRERWRAETVVVHGVTYRPAALDGFVAWDGGRRVGAVTYHLDEGCEIVTLDALEEGRGIGSALLEEVVIAAGDAGCDRLWLITTNDNERAIAWYRRRGFDVVAVHEGAVERSRELKPEIALANPETGMPITDEIEMRKPV